MLLTLLLGLTPVARADPYHAAMWVWRAGFIGEVAGAAAIGVYTNNTDQPALIWGGVALVAGGFGAVDAGPLIAARALDRVGASRVPDSPGWLGILAIPACGVGTALSYSGGILVDGVDCGAALVLPNVQAGLDGAAAKRWYARHPPIDPDSDSSAENLGSPPPVTMVAPGQAPPARPRPRVLVSAAALPMRGGGEVVFGGAF